MTVTASSALQSVSAIQSGLTMLTALHLSSFPDIKKLCLFDGQSYDYIIVGGGTAGCVLANRLAEDNVTVLLIEAGGNLQIENEMAALMLYAQSNRTTWPYSEVPTSSQEETHKLSEDDMALGKVIGGCSSNGYATYSSGCKEDYNNWAKKVNDSTWQWDNALQYLKKSQRLENKNIIKSDGTFYGENGNVGLNIVNSIDTQPYLQMVKEAGQANVSAINGNRCLGYTNALATISRNVIQSTAITYLFKKLNNNNMFILTNTTVIKVLFDACKNAIGVVVENCGRFIYVKAKIEVILSAGVVNTPQLLMLSGIGPKKQLCKHKIHTIADLPVGDDFQDHIGVTMVCNFTKQIIPYRPFKPTHYPAGILVGYAALNNINTYPDYNVVEYINLPSNLMNFCVFTYDYNNTICNDLIETNVNTQMMYVIIKKQTLQSRGRITLRSNNYKDPPIIDFKPVEDDINELAKYIQHFLKIQDTKTFQKLGGEFKDPKLSKCGKFDLKNLDYLTCYTKYMMTSQHEYSSTCQMGRVVNSRLMVYGVQKLRIVDASVMPSPTAGGTLGSTIMIAEMAADMIKQDRKKYEGCCKTC